MTIRARNGNALVYVLIAVALMVALAYAISRDMGGQQASRSRSDQLQLLASGILSHSASAEQVVFQMAQFGRNYDELLFDTPTDADYTTDTPKQVYHPSGGGLTVFQANNSSYFDPVSIHGERGWHWQNQNNVEWTPSAQTDLIYSFLDINPEVCAIINEKLTGDPAIPATTVNFGQTLTMLGSNDDFQITLCPECEDKKALCIKNATTYAFYNIIGSR